MPFSGKLVEKTVFTDIDMRFVAHPDTSQLMTVKNHKAISQAIKCLVLTDRYERPFQKNLGGDIYASLFENFDPITVKIIQNAVRDVINNFEPRAELQSVDLYNDLERNGIAVTVRYKPINTKVPVVIDLFLERVR